MASASATSTTESITNTVSDAINCESIYYYLRAVGREVEGERRREGDFIAPVYVSETIQGKSAESKKEGNKEIAKGNTNASIGDRISAGVDAIGNKADESKHDSKAEAYKTSAQH
ncbi:hypothetical protein RHOSPDRAFT_26957 [Rhodotorula sp. JG-1b]|nr:hypothetical protein RHOSPDRAFT_26957 [Rhodotorula sp. JG-1b]